MNYTFSDNINFSTTQISDEEISDFFFSHPNQALYFLKEGHYLGELTLPTFRETSYIFQESALRYNLLVCADFEEDAFLFEKAVANSGDGHVLLRNGENQYRELIAYSANSFSFDSMKKINAAKLFSAFKPSLLHLFANKKVALLTPLDSDIRPIGPEQIIHSFKEIDHFDLVVDCGLDKPEASFYKKSHPSLVSSEEMIFPLLCSRILHLFRKKGVKLYIGNMPKAEFFTINAEEKSAVECRRNLSAIFEKTDYLKKVFPVNSELEFAKTVGSHAYEECIVVQDNYRFVAGSKTSYYTIKRRHRVTLPNGSINAPKLYFFGPCIAFGLFATDNHTIESYLSRLLIQDKKDVRIENCGVPDGGDVINDLLFMAHSCFRPGDTCVWLSRFSQSEIDTLTKLGISVDDLSLPLKERHYWFLNDTVHCTCAGNQAIAEYIFQRLPHCPKQNCTKRLLKMPFLSIKNTETKYRDYLLQNRVITPGRIGCIVVNADPFTKGHLYLANEALKKVNFLYVFLVENCNDTIPFYERYLIAKHACNCYQNVKVLSAGDYFASEQSFTAYYHKNNSFNPAGHIRYFLRYVVPTLNITDRFFGEEPTNKMTRRFNNYCAIVLPKNGITTTIIKRATSNGAPISASTVREMMNKGRLDKIKEYLDGWGANFLIKKSGANK
jgi:hypothetical protein